jgi:SAM-dependent methyltransferase
MTDVLALARRAPDIVGQATVTVDAIPRPPARHFRRTSGAAEAVPDRRSWASGIRHDVGVPDESESRAAQRDLVRRGYDAVSRVYRTDAGESSAGSAETTSTYAPWIEELSSRLALGARVLDIGCGAGLPADRLLVEAGFEVTGIDISQIQIDRARVLVPQATFVCRDIVDFVLEPESVDAIISLYALIHLPLDDQRDLLPRVVQALRPGGLFLAIVGHEQWTGVEDYLGAPMFWDHADEHTYLTWLRNDGFEVLWHRYIPEGTVGHTLVLARRPQTAR